MKRNTDTPEPEWSEAMRMRKLEAERLMLIEDHKKGFITIEEIKQAASLWKCSQHEAEMRLMRGDLPE